MKNKLLSIAVGGFCSMVLAVMAFGGGAGVVTSSMTGMTAHAAAAPFAALDVFSGQPGTTVNVSGGNFQPDETVNIFLGSTLNPPTASTTVRADSLFGPVAIVVPPSSVQGQLLITAVGASSSLQASNSFFVQGLSPSITATSTSNTPGSTLVVNGTGFAPSEKVQLSFGNSSSTATCDSTGSFFAATITIPFVPSGTYTLNAVGLSSHANATFFQFVGGFFPVLTPSTFFAAPGTDVTFSGTNFAANETVNIFNGTSTTGSSTLQATTNGSGNFSGIGPITIPFNAASSSVTFTAVGATSNAKAAASIGVGNLNPMVTPSAFFIAPGQQLMFSGSGFGKSETINVTSAATTTPLATFTTDSTGAFTNAGSFAVPFTVAGTSATFTLTGQTSGASVPVQITVASFFPVITPSSFFLQRGNVFMIKATGFAANETIAVSALGNPTMSAFADASGTAGIGPFTVPLFASKSYLVTAVGSSSSATATTTVTVGDAVARVPATSTLNVILNVDNTIGGTATSSDFTVTMNAPSSSPATFPGDASGTAVTILGDTDFTVSISSMPGYQISFGGHCSGQVPSTLSDTCTITETFAPPMDMLTTTLPDGTVGQAYSATISASTTATGSFAWSVASGTLPDGLLLETSSTVSMITISGTPTTAGAFTFAIKAANGASTATQSFTVNINAAQTNTGGGGGGSTGGGGSGTVVVNNNGGGGGGGGTFISTNTGGGGGGGGGGSFFPTTPGVPNTGTGGEVLGVSTANPAVMLASLTTQLIALEKQLIGQQLKEASCSVTFTRTLRKGMANNEVKNLQRVLNMSGLTQVAVSGPGAPGNESTFFGNGTVKAVISFQNIFADDILKPAGLTAGNGIVGPGTRAKLNALCSGAGTGTATAINL